MGPIFGEYIFVRFFQRDCERTSDDRYWPLYKFSDLLMQLRYYITPEVDAIPDDSLYKSWWQPSQEVVVIKAKNMSLTPVEVPNTISSQTKMPEIFISYQWDKQVQIKALHRRLAGVGYNCWLDILQMGGGDSLFDKIDQGLRGCKVVLSCVTTKYGKSANCRREVALADALKKPIIPLLLEQITWPPEGPMGPILTQLLYVNFAQPNEAIQNSWNCPQFDSLMQLLSRYVPINTATTASTGSDNEKPNATKQGELCKLPDKNNSVDLQKTLDTTGGAKRSVNSQPNTATVNNKTTFCTII